MHPFFRTTIQERASSCETQSPSPRVLAWLRCSGRGPWPSPGQGQRGSGVRRWRVRARHRAAVRDPDRPLSAGMNPNRDVARHTLRRTCGRILGIIAGGTGCVGSAFQRDAGSTPAASITWRPLGGVLGAASGGGVWQRDAPDCMTKLGQTPHGTQRFSAHLWSPWRAPPAVRSARTWEAPAASKARRARGRGRASCERRASTPRSSVGRGPGFPCLESREQAPVPAAGIDAGKFQSHRQFEGRPARTPTRSPHLDWRADGRTLIPAAPAATRLGS